MIGKISPLVEEAGREVWARAVAVHTVGLVLSAATLGLVLGALGAFAHVAVPVLLLTAAWGILTVILGCCDLGILRIRIPASTRQTPGAWKCVYGPEWSALLWGIDLGQGWTVRVPFIAFIAIVAWPLAAGQLGASVAVLTTYGVGKAIPVAAARAIARFRGEDASAFCLAQRPAVGLLIGAATVFVGAYVLGTLGALQYATDIAPTSMDWAWRP